MPPASLRQRSAYTHALGAVLLWSTVASAFKLTLALITPMQLVAYATCVSASLLAALVALRHADGLRALLPATAREWGWSLLLGGLNPLLYYAVLFAAYARLPAQEAQLLNYTWAITMTLLSVPLLGHRISPRDGAAVLLAYGGAAVIATRGELLAVRFHDPVGAGLALGSTVIWALYWLLNARDDREPQVALARNFLCAAPLSLLAAALLGSLRIHRPLALLGAAYVGVFEMGLSFVLWLKALKLTESAAKISTLIFLSPLLSLVLIRFVVGEEIHASTLVGLVLILAGNALQHARSRG